MEHVIQAAVLCVVAALLGLVLKKGTPEAALLLSLGAAAVVLLSLAGSLEELLDFLGELTEQSGLSSVVETAGAVCALLAALPLLRAVLALLLELMQ